MGRFEARDLRIADAAAAVCLSAIVLATEFAQGKVNLTGTLAAVVVSSTVAFRRRAPASMALLAAAGVSVAGSSSPAQLVGSIAFVLDYYMAVRKSAERGWTWIDVALLALPVLGIVLSPNTPEPGDPFAVDVVSVWAFFFVIPFAAGRIVGGRIALTAALKVNTKRLAEEQRDRARRVAAAERARIARELHDVVAHSVSVMVIQAVAARAVAGRDRDAAAEALRWVERCGREALTDLRDFCQRLPRAGNRRHRSRIRSRACCPGTSRSWTHGNARATSPLRGAIARRERPRRRFYRPCHDPAARGETAMRVMSRRYWPSAGWWDLALGAAFGIVCEAEVVVHLRGDRAHDHWPAAAVVTIVAGIAVAVAARRRAPLATTSVAMAGIVILALSLSHLTGINSPQLVLFVAPYTVAAYSPRIPAIAGLAVCIAAMGTLSAVSASESSGWVFTIGVCGCSWVAGRFIRARRALAAELRQTNERIAAETEGRETLALADQRTRIAQELQILVAHSVSTMTVQSEAAQRLLDQDSDQADAAMEKIEATGRHALDEMRRILGVLRHSDDHAELVPQPGVGQIPALVEKMRGTQPDLTLRVEGKPGPLPASVDLAVYRLLADALSTVAGPSAPIDVLLRFSAEDITLSVTASQAVRLDWPTIAMCERVALCQGTIDVESLPGTGERLVINLPCVLTGALA